MDIVFETLKLSPEEKKELEKEGKVVPSTDNFEKWLQGFTELDESLLIEIDLVNDLFIAKSFTQDRTVVKYGKISFEDCGFSVLGINTAEGTQVSVTEWNEQNSGRVYVGLLHTLKKFIQTVKLFGAEPEFKMIVRFDQVDIEKIGTVFMASKVEFKSMEMTMIARGYNLTEFNLMLFDDEKFNKVATIASPVSFSYRPDVQARILNGTQINSTDPKKDIIYFDIVPSDSSFILTAHDKNREYYEYRVSNQMLEGSAEPKECASPVTRANFITANKGYTPESYIITVSAEQVPQGRIKIETSDNIFTTIVANVRTS